MCCRYFGLRVLCENLVLCVVSSGVAVERSCIFISYRRDDARGASGRVWDWLRIGFGRDRVFRDVASIGAGKWQQKIEQALAASKACVAVIGRRWADATNLPRLQDPGDMVRHELETALVRGERDELTRRVGLTISWLRCNKRGHVESYALISEQTLRVDRPPATLSCVTTDSLPAPSIAALILPESLPQRS